MTIRSRIAITSASTLLLGAFTYGHAFDISPPGVLNDIWSGSLFGSLLIALVVVGVFLVNRWWALLPAFAPAAVTIYLHATDYLSPWHEDLSGEPWYLIGGTVLLVAFLSLALLLRAVWERIRTAHRAFSSSA
ncbi:MAG TPA: hypothetical protein VIP57_08640 [Candidatus Dormibacteraeota bacterium]